ncbi:hypothetical protein [Arthrobacter rhizosphaerae]|uniref:hypothetical protein n=1 Tax=Arthrobacter rhizosphaerae TaxID=2855490 RepID=UPI001FF48805|nr:hypothetical protein [Arthrobacter rhizosphaerae]
MNRRIRGGIRAAGAVMVAGSASFLTGAFMPVSRVYVEREPQRKLEILLADPVQWRAELAFLGAGTIVLPVGVAMLARHWGEDRGLHGLDRPPGRRLAVAGTVLLAAGAGAFLVDLSARFNDPEGFALGHQPLWPFHAYMWSSLAGMAALGGALLREKRRDSGSGIPRWPGWLNLGGAAAFAGVLAGTGDIPPLFVYLVGFATGAALILRGRENRSHIFGGSE